MQNQRIHISIAFGDALLPVIKCDDGQERVPLKPISDQIGLDWKTQKRKILNDTYLTERLGVVMGEVNLPQLAQLSIKKDQYLIRFDRVTAFLNALNPQSIRGQGNEKAADWLQAKHAEWDDALHRYENHGIAVKSGNTISPVIKTLAQIDRIKNPELKRMAAIDANRSLGLNIPVGERQTLDVE